MEKNVENKYENQSVQSVADKLLLLLLLLKLHKIKVILLQKATRALYKINVTSLQL